jgi:chorismate mutase
MRAAIQYPVARRRFRGAAMHAIYDGCYRQSSGRRRKRCVPFQVQVQDQVQVQGEAVGMDIYDWRKKIDEMDDEIVRLISRRAEAAKAIGTLKRKTLAPVYEPDREQAVFNHVRAVNPGPLADSEMQHIYERLIDVMRTLQKREQ